MKNNFSHNCLTFKNENQSNFQLSLFGDDSDSQKPNPNRRNKIEDGLFKKRQKPQISSIPETSPKQRDRYRVVCGGRILGDRLAIDEALKLANLSK